MSIRTGSKYAENTDFVATYLMVALAQEDSQLVAVDERVRALSEQIQGIERRIDVLQRVQSLLSEVYETKV